LTTDTSQPPLRAPDYSAPADGATKYRWVVCALLFFATTINYIDRQILSLIKEILDQQLHWTNTEFGLTNSAFQAAYGLSLLGFGYLIDRFGTKIGYALSIGLWSIAAAGHALVGSISGFVAARVALGLGEAGNFPAAIKATAQWFPKRERAFSTALFNSGANVGALIAPATIPFIALNWGWHATFLCAAAAGFVWIVFWWIFYEVPERSRFVNQKEVAYIESDRDEPAQERKMPWGSLLAYPQTWSFVVAKFLTDPVWWFFLIWLPDYFKKTRHLDIKTSWVHIVTIYGIVTLLSVFGGWVTGYLTKQGWSVTRARKTGMFIFALCVVPIVFATSVGIWTAVILIGIAGAAHQAWSANLFTTVSDMFPKRAVASVTGIGGMAGSMGGMLFPYISGVMLDKFPNRGYGMLFAICGSAYIVAFILNHVLAPKFEQVRIIEPAGFNVERPNA
jgi:ACS family hexuronate transporter-like MFS transporter